MTKVERIVSHFSYNKRLLMRACESVEHTKYREKHREKHTERARES